MSLDEIGFHTLSDYRVKNVSGSSPMWRCELIVTTRCNFKCDYCRGPEALPADCRADLSEIQALGTLDLWVADGLRNVRFSGGEPTLYPHLGSLVSYCRRSGVGGIAVSSNGSCPQEVYESLLLAGVNDWAISLDACCASTGDGMSGVKRSWQVVVDNIRYLSVRSHTTVGVVLTDENITKAHQIVQFAHDLGVADIRLISAAQQDRLVPGLEAIPKTLLDVHPLLKYRVNHYLAGRNVRGIEPYDSHQCALVLDDSIIAGNYHFPCPVYMRESGEPIGKVGLTMRTDRVAWNKSHNSHGDLICRRNCLDVCIDYNNAYAACHPATCHYPIG